ncbi:MAG: aminotransferase class I/II-fold pyridoxal phosphate-dependent enzyme, partial [Mycobacterium sp.]
GRLRLGPGWISHLLQDLVVGLWRDDAATRQVHQAETLYTRNRQLLQTALADRGVPSSARSGLNVWVPVPDETVAITRLLSAGWAAAPGTRFRINSAPGIRITVSELDPADIEPLADAIVEAVHGVGGASM